ncbi:MAG: DNA polymerase III subunit epsilon [Gammaproteobacteria bacterium]
MSRQIILDTETTGLKPEEGHRIIEIGAVEMINRKITGNNLQLYINPERDIDEQAQAVHGISLAFLADKPVFADIASLFLEFIQDADLIIHNAPFDLGFLNAELQRHSHTLNRLEKNHCIIDTLVLAREKHPGQKNSLDALCKRYNIDNSSRNLHGALLDAEILGQVYLAMTSGQTSLFMDVEADVKEIALQPTHQSVVMQKTQALKVIYASADELSAHQTFLQKYLPDADEW